MRYEIIMSSGRPVEIEEDELQKVMAGAQRKAIVICRQGIVNPAHLVSIIPSKDPYEGTNIARSEQDAPKPLKDCFAALRERINIIAGPDKPLAIT